MNLNPEGRHRSRRNSQGHSWEQSCPRTCAVVELVGWTRRACFVDREVKKYQFKFFHQRPCRQHGEFETTVQPLGLVPLGLGRGWKLLACREVRRGI